MFPSILITPIVFGLLIWSLFAPALASIFFILLVTLFEGFMYFHHRYFKTNIKTNVSPYFLTPDEMRVMDTYNLYFRFPSVSKGSSSSLSLIQISTFIWVPWLLYNTQWIASVFISINYFLAGSLAPFLNPRFFLHDAVENKGQTEFIEEMKLVDSVVEKISPSPTPNPVYEDDLKGGVDTNLEAEKALFENIKPDAEQGNPFAQYVLGQMYYNGKGVTQNYVESIKLYRLSAEQGIAEAQLDIGMMYCNGEGVIQDFVEAYKWFNIAVANGEKFERKDRDAIEERMTLSQIADAQKLAKDWMEEHGKK